MPTDFAFRLSTYLTLFLSCAALGYAELDLLPEAAVFAFIVAGLLGLAFHQEGKLELSLTAANRLGMVIGILAMVWLAFQIVRPSGGLIYSLPWPASMLPYIGPLVMILMPAKLFRPKHIGDWWTMHGVGLAAVALGCAMADDLTFGVIASCYLITGAWSLSLFFLRRAAGTISPIPGREASEPRSVVVTGEISSAPKTLLGRAFATRPLWALAAASGIGATLFFITPRINGPTWNLSRTREVGYGGDESAPDLTRGGELKGVNREVAFEVVARNADGSPKDDLPTTMRWRGRSFLEYNNGKWSSNTPIRVMFARGANAVANSDLANGVLSDENAKLWSLDFRWLARKKDAVLADPVMWTPGQSSPIFSLQGMKMPWAQIPDGSFFPFSRDTVGQYRQICRPQDEPDLGPVFELVNWNPRGADGKYPADSDPLAGYEVLMNSRLPAVRDYSRTVLEQLVKSGKLPAEILHRLDPATRNVSPGDQEIVARAMNAFLTESNEFTYALKSPIVEKGIDPIEDFLFRSKAGSCERFATALVQLLRGLGIPCKMVIGFKGAEYDSAGKYLVRQEFAHAWVEVLVRRPTPKGYTSLDNVPNRSMNPYPTTAAGAPGATIPSVPPSGSRFGPSGPVPPPEQPALGTPKKAMSSNIMASVDGEQPAVIANPDPPLPPAPPPAFLYAWLSLDPTPNDGESVVDANGLTGSMQSIWQSIGEWFSSLIVKYDPDARDKLFVMTWEWIKRHWLIVMESVFVVAAAVVALRLCQRAIARRKLIVRPVSSLPEWYQRFESIAAARGVLRTDTETPTEHAARFAATLPAEQANWPHDVAQLFIEIRYGGTASDPHRVSAIEQELAKLNAK